MAVKDLERHLQVGWQSISFAAGVIAVLSAGQQGYLPAPLAVIAALAISFWGVQNIIDADYWARRAIAFLANVEAVYFYYEERRVCNPYAGSHPSLKILDSLNSQLNAALVFSILTIMYFAWSVSHHVHSYLVAGNPLSQVSYFKFGFWISPLFFLLFFFSRALRMKRDRISDYQYFVDNCPGPGMVKTRAKWRGVDLDGDALPVDIITGEDLQRPVREEIARQLNRWTTLFKVTRSVCNIAATALTILLFLQRCVLGLVSHQLP
jgi:hypothetical protein